MASGSTLSTGNSVTGPGASAVVVHSGGHFLGVTPRPGVAPAALSGSVAAAPATPAATVNPASYAWENLNYQGGPVLHSSQYADGEAWRGGKNIGQYFILVRLDP